MDLADLFEQGGPLMWVILVASIVGVAVFLERMWSLQRARVLPRTFVDRIRGLVSKRKTSEALLLCEENGSSIALLMAAALRTHQYKKSRAVTKEAVEEVGNREIAHMDRNVEIVGTVASITPLMGLLGTVIGMISVFQNFVESYKSGMVGPDTFAEGIWQALITTAFGLTVAIPMLLAYKFLQGRNDRLVVEMEEDAMGIVDLLEDGQRPSVPDRDGRDGRDGRDDRARVRSRERDGHDESSDDRDDRDDRVRDERDEEDRR
jgi:biopolymer transport protein ExbB